MRFGVIFSVLVCFAVTACLAFAAPKDDSNREEMIRVTVIGKLTTGIVAIGGETTGTTITANGITWELDFGRNNDLRTAAEKWNGQHVLVRGQLSRRAGVEIRERWIVSVSPLRQAPRGEVDENEEGALRVTPKKKDTE